SRWHEIHRNGRIFSWCPPGRAFKRGQEGGHGFNKDQRLHGLAAAKRLGEPRVAGKIAKADPVTQVAPFVYTVLQQVIKHVDKAVGSSLANIGVGIDVLTQVDGRVDGTRFALAEQGKVLGGRRNNALLDGGGYVGV